MKQLSLYLMVHIFSLKMFLIFPTNIALRSALHENPILCIPKKGIAWSQSQFPHSFVCERFIYQSTYIPAAEQADRLWEYINRSQTHECGWKLGLRPSNSFSGNIRFNFSVLCLCSVFLLAVIKYRVNKNFVFQEGDPKNSALEEERAASCGRSRTGSAQPEPATGLTVVPTHPAALYQS
jgi:hypothetical protein